VTVRLFACPSCKLIVFFENVACERCATALGYEPAANTMIALSPRDPDGAHTATAGRIQGERYR
jgi:hypothetical protein